MKEIGVIGAGTMGRGIAQCLAEYGFDVCLVDISNEILEKAKQEIFNICRTRCFLLGRKKKIDLPDTILSRIKFTTDINTLVTADCIIENVVEKLEVKKKVYQDIIKVCKEDTLYIANTSCISITTIASFTNKPSNVLGIHFMNPVHMITAVEVIKGQHTSKETVDRALNLLNVIEKESIIIEDSTGFISNRISHLMINEAAHILSEKLVTAEDVDAIFKKCYGHKMGPLETADLIGLDTVRDSLDILYEYYHDNKFKCSPLIIKMVDMGLLGIKSGEGFYKY